MTAYILRRLLATIPGHGRRCAVRVSPAPPHAGRSGRGHRRRRRVAGGDRGHPPQARSRPPDMGAVRRLRREPAARRPRHVDLLQPAGDDAGAAAPRADDRARRCDAGRRRRLRDSDGRRRGLEGAHEHRPDRHGLFRARLRGSGVPCRLPAHLRLRHPAALASGSGLSSARRKGWTERCARSRCRPLRSAWPTWR